MARYPIELGGMLGEIRYLIELRAVRNLMEELRGNR